MSPPWHWRPSMRASLGRCWPEAQTIELCPCNRPWPEATGPGSLTARRRHPPGLLERKADGTRSDRRRMSLNWKTVLDTERLMRPLRATVIRAASKDDRPDIFVQSDPESKSGHALAMQGESIYFQWTRGLL